MNDYRAVVYCRVSTKEQAQSGLSIDEQRERCLAYCEASRWEVVEVVTDEAESGKDMQRPGLQKALDVLSKKRANILVFQRLEHLTRSVMDMGIIIDKKKEEGWEIASLEDEIDSTTASGRLGLHVLISVSQWERERAAERTKEALNQKQKKKEKTGGIRPYGYDVVIIDDRKKLVENKHEQKILRLIIEMREDGYTLDAIRRELRRRKIKTVKGSTDWKLWTISYLCKRYGIPGKPRKTRSDKGVRKLNKE